MKIPRNHVGKIKTALHGLQAAFVFVGFCLTIAVLVNGETDGRTKYYFTLCFFTVPALVYLVMVPRWPRAAKIANVHVFAIVDIIFAIFWLAAFIAVATYNPDNMDQDSEEESENEDKNEDEGGCSPLCSTNRATVAFGVFNFLLFLATSGISLYDIMQYRRDGTSVIIQSAYLKPSSDATAGTAIGLDAHSKDAWSADTGDLNEMGRYDHHDDHDDDNDDNHLHGYENHGGGGGDHGIMASGSSLGRLGGYGAVDDNDDDQHALLGSAGEPGRRPSPSGWGAAAAAGGGAGGAVDGGIGGDGGGGGRFNEDTSYHADAVAAPPPPTDGRRYDGAWNTGYPQAGSTGIDQAGKIKFPAGNYSFSG